MGENNLLRELFTDASGHQGDFIYCLLRVAAAEHHKEDPLLVLCNCLDAGSASRADLDKCEALWHLYANLHRLQRGFHYMPFPFDASTQNYRETTLSLYTNGSPITQALQELRAKTDPKKELKFIKDFLDYYYLAIREFGSFKHRYYKLDSVGSFEVFEILLNGQGLCGFRVHFSNDSSAYFERKLTGVEMANLAPGNAVDFFVGRLDEMKNAWRVSGKWLYEVGIPGRYNEPGEWKPLVYPPSGDTKLIQDVALAASDDIDIQGVTFYMLATGYPVIEFVVKARVKLPDNKTTFPHRIILEQAFPPDNQKNSNIFVYDGTLRLSDVSVEGVQKGLQAVRAVVDSLGFTLRSEVRWRVKYRIRGRTKSAAMPNKKDLKNLKEIIRSLAKHDAAILNSALSWFNLGLQTDDAANAFLCMFMAIEGVAVMLAKGELKVSKDFGLPVSPFSTQEKRQLYDEYYRQFYSVDLQKLIDTSYFEISKSITKNMKDAVAAVFGKSHAAHTKMFKGKGNLVALRGIVVHQISSQWNREDYEKIVRELPHLEDIAFHFLSRVLLKAKLGAKLPQWSRRFQVTQHMDDPRNTLIISPDLRHLPRKDWKILPEWVD